MDPTDTDTAAAEVTREIIENASAASLEEDLAAEIKDGSAKDVIANVEVAGTAAVASTATVQCSEHATEATMETLTSACDTMVKSWDAVTSEDDASESPMETSSSACEGVDRAEEILENAEDVTESAESLEGVIRRAEEIVACEKTRTEMEEDQTDSTDCAIENAEDIMKQALRLAEKTKRITKAFGDINTPIKDTGNDSDDDRICIDTDSTEQTEVSSDTGEMHYRFPWDFSESEYSEYSISAKSKSVIHGIVSEVLQNHDLPVNLFDVVNITAGIAKNMVEILRDMDEVTTDCWTHTPARMKQVKDGISIGPEHVHKKIFVDAITNEQMSSICKGITTEDPAWVRAVAKMGKGSVWRD